MENKVIKCKNCILDSSFPKVKIDLETELCNYCVEFQKISKEKKIEEEKKVINHIKKLNGEKYDLIVALSGGKDSSYTMLQIYNQFSNLKMLGVLVDNGFISKLAKENAKKICKYTKANLKIIDISSKELNDLFKKVTIEKFFPNKTLERATSICLICSGLFKQIIFAEAIKNKCYSIAFGWTPGQSFKSIITINKEFLLLNKKNFEKILSNTNCSDKILKYIPKENVYKSLNSGLYLLHPMSTTQYNEKNMIKELKNRIGWKMSLKADMNTSNCKLNSFAILTHKQKYGFHPYALEIAGLVRSNCISKEEGIEKLNNNFPKKLIKENLNKLEFNIKDLEKL